MSGVLVKTHTLITHALYVFIEMLCKTFREYRFSVYSSLGLCTFFILERRSTMEKDKMIEYIKSLRDNALKNYTQSERGITTSKEMEEAEDKIKGERNPFTFFAL